jgi:hypothetical protein
MDLTTAQPSDFIPSIGTEFHTDDKAGGAIALELVEASPLPSQSGAPRPEPFSLILRGPPD